MKLLLSLVTVNTNTVVYFQNINISIIYLITLPPKTECYSYDCVCQKDVLYVMGKSKYAQTHVCMF